MRIDEAILIMENERPHCGDKLTFTEEERHEAYTLALMALRDLQRAYDEGYKQGRYDEKVETETSLPNGEQTHALRTETHACDLISRAAAIDAFEDTTFTKNEIRRRLSDLPSAQPPVLTCDGCKHVGTYDTDFPCSRCIRREKDYYAQE